MITLSDLSYRVGLFSLFMSRPKAEHLQCAQMILRYVCGTKDRTLLYRARVATTLVGYMDVDWAENVCDCRSTSGFTFSLGSVTIAWSNKKQTTVALSSTEPSIEEQLS